MPCFHCEKGILFGRTHTHHRGVAGGRWKKRAPKKQRIFVANLQPVHLLIDGKDKRVKLCTKCIKRVKKDIHEGKRPFVTFAKYQPQKETVKEEVKVKSAVKKTKNKSKVDPSPKEKK
ncbi:hypothetical protein COY87_05525 [Candidatus Roizmanbacteria bacterium CG_4_10_14_0_8_um_filter_33_9]|uniref:50S ribosomal protein L28 n=1 Tax=Candidatus Roizmanbacteria bacterium CG_4_10_14_0_8_um_filter_33_9 TaxID=1974826 RepID=A0A2M7QHV5_9BACT|nr:MAG: hypothetical protein COY87_05525 [Candidatus Roizmanbacteria bacterium CG_4_10_14_0_8_um_filter_33_9]